MAKTELFSHRKQRITFYLFQGIKRYKTIEFVHLRHAAACKVTSTQVCSNGKEWGKAQIGPEKAQVPP